MDTTADSFQTSPYQEALWLSEPEGPTVATQAVLELTGPVDPDLLRGALQRSVDRHEILRTTFTHRPGIRVPLQVVNDRIAPDWAIHDLSPHDAAEQARQIADLRAGELSTPFHLQSGPLLRAAFLTQAPDRHTLVVTVSGLAADAASAAQLTTELIDHLGGGGGLAEEPLQYADYSAWQHEMAEGEDPERQSAGEFWRGASELGAPELPFADAGAPRSAPEEIAVPLDGEQAATLRSHAQRYGATTSALVQASWQTLLGRLTGEDAVTVAYVPSERRHGDLNGAIGAFSRPVPVRAKITRATFAEVLGEVQRGREQALVWQDYAPTHDAGEAVVAFIAEEPAHGAAGAVSVTLRQVTVTGPRLWVACGEAESELRIRLGYDPAYLAGEHASRLAGELGALLRSVAVDPGVPVAELDLLGETERRQLLGDFNDVPAPADLRAIPDRFAAHAAAEPSRPAVLDEQGELSYSELDAQANQLAQRLTRGGVGPGDAVGLCTARSRQMVVGLLGILKAGAAYVPLHYEHPPARLGHQLTTAGAKAIVTQAALLSHLPEFSGEVICLDRDGETLAGEPATAPVLAFDLDQLAYVIYTSGSTGLPKGVGVTHRNLANYTAAISDRLDAEAEPLSFGLVTSISTDLGNTSVFGALGTGGSLVLVSPVAAADAGVFARTLAATPVDVLKITPSHIGALASGGDAGVLPRRWLVVGGERAPWDLVERVRALAPELRILNHYGPTETTIGATTHEVTVDSRRYRPGTVPIGGPLAGDAAYVLDDRHQPVAIGVRGRLFVAGAGVAGGYIGAPELTAERFLPDPFVSGRRMYDTGDVVRWLPDGQLEFIGRADEQVKIRGYRVEPAEVESALRSHAQVQEAVVVSQIGPAGDARLVAYAVTDGGAERPQSEMLLAHLAEWVPEFMLPSAIVLLDELPRTPSGKIDRLALPDPGEVAATTEEYVAPRTPMEDAVAAIWIRVLGAPQVGVHDDFFTLGGHSLLATQVVAQVRSDFAVDLPLHGLFTHPTVESLTAEIVKMMGDSEEDETARLLSELEGLSDEDAERLLAGEQPTDS